MKYDFPHGKMYEIPAKIMHIKKFRLYFMKRAPNSEESAVTEHFFIQIGGNMVSEHEMRQIGSGRIDWAEKRISSGRKRILLVGSQRRRKEGPKEKRKESRKAETSTPHGRGCCVSACRKILDAI